MGKRREVVAAGIGTAGVLASLAFPDAGPLSVAPPWWSVPAALCALGFFWAPRSERLRRLVGRVPTGWWEGMAIGWTLLVFGLLKVPGIHPSGTDDNIYFYMAQRFAQGVVPYRDFFFSHPPIHLLVPALLFLPGGFDLVLAKSIPVLAQAIAAVLVWRALRPHSPGMGVLAAGLHLFAYQVLMGSTDMNGENLMTAFLAGSLWAVLGGRMLLGGALASLALGCGLYALAGAATLGLASALVSGRRGLVRFAVGLSAVTGAWVGIFWALGGAAFWDGVVTYHLGKAVSDPGKVSLFGSGRNLLAAWLQNLGVSLFSREFLKFLQYHALAFLGLAWALVWLVMQGVLGLAGNRTRLTRNRRERRKRSIALPREHLASGEAREPSDSRMVRLLPVLAVVGVAAFEAQWAALAETYDFYRVPMSPFLAIAAAWVLVQAGRGIPRGGSSAWVGLIVLISMAMHPLLRGALSASLWPEERQAAGERVFYTWKEPWVPVPLAELSRKAFFRDFRIRGVEEPPWRHALWNKQLTFRVVDDVAREVRDGSDLGETLIGASTLAPLVALRADRRLAGDEADTNAKRFTTGQWSEEALARMACRDRVRWMVAAPRSRFEPARVEKDPLWSGLFERYREFSDPHLLHRRPFPVVLFRLRPGARLPDGTPCRQEPSP